MGSRRRLAANRRQQSSQGNQRSQGSQGSKLSSGRQKVERIPASRNSVQKTSISRINSPRTPTPKFANRPGNAVNLVAEVFSPIVASQTPTQRPRSPTRTNAPSRPRPSGRRPRPRPATVGQQSKTATTRQVTGSGKTSLVN